jgi:hypothetical protein
MQLTSTANLQGSVKSQTVTKSLPPPHVGSLKLVPSCRAYSKASFAPVYPLGTRAHVRTNSEFSHNECFHKGLAREKPL